MDCEIAIHQGRYNAPPPFDHGGMDVAAIAIWLQVGQDWYRWHGRNTLQLRELLARMDGQPLAELLAIAGKDLEPWAGDDHRSSP